MISRFILILIILFNFAKAEDETIHPETEYKLRLNTEKNPSEVRIEFNKLMQKLFFADKILNHQYTLKKQSYDFLFLDIYADSQTNELLKKKQVYRLRSRYKVDETIELTPASLRRAIRSNKSIRTEIQFKVYNPQNDINSSKELRFSNEELNQLKNKISKKSLPPYLLDVLKTGSFQGTPIKFFQEYNLKQYQFTKYYPILTHRTRYHIVSDAALGSGNNPQHTILISLDMYYLLRNNNLGVFPQYEIEIEVERNKNNMLETEVYRGYERLRKELAHYIVKNSPIPASFSTSAKIQQILKQIRSK